jgi:hypothetical protein
MLAQMLEEHGRSSAGLSRALRASLHTASPCCINDRVCTAITTVAHHAFEWLATLHPAWRAVRAAAASAVISGRCRAVLLHVLISLVCLLQGGVDSRELGGSTPGSARRNSLAGIFPFLQKQQSMDTGEERS